MKNLLTLSKNAVLQLNYILSKRRNEYIRVGVTKRGCNGISYKMEYINYKGKHDELVEIDGVKLLIESNTFSYVVGIEIDYISDFTFNNPNSKGKCGCGESFKIH
jgi:iron-sulfur cluster assembly protein